MERTYDVAQAAKYLNVSTSTIYRLIEFGDLPASRLGTVYCIRIRLEDLETYKRHKEEEGKWL